jgi:glycine/D-amino acid oxidase-like deaminating enzyme
VYKKVHGTEQALKIIANERTVFEKVDEFVKKHGVNCDFNPTTTFDVCMTQEFADFNAQSLKEYKEAGGDVSHIKFYAGEEAKKRTRVQQAVAAYEWPAGSSHPAKLVHWLLTESIAKGARLFTHCPAVAIAPSSEGAWDVSTPRGTVTATTVVHCTNAFAPHLLPQLAAYVTPNRAQAHAFVPPASLNGTSVLPSTMSLRHSLKHFYSVAQRRPDGIIVLGASRNNPNVNDAAVASRLIPDDSFINEEVRDDAVSNFVACFPECDARNLRTGEGLWHTWTGIIAMTPDSVPLVGQVPGAPGQWICAGFNGHGKRPFSVCSYNRD